MKGRNFLMQKNRYIVLIIILLLVVGCSSQLTEPPYEDDNQQPLQDNALEDYLATRGANLPTPFPTSTQDSTNTVQTNNLAEENSVFIVEMKQDLADRLAINPTNIQLVLIESVDWTDGSLGCAQPGELYIQVITPGYRVVFSDGDVQYSYHTKDTSFFIFCDRNII